MMRFKGTWSMSGLLFGFLILIPYISTYYLVTKPSSAKAAVSPTFSPAPMEYVQENPKGPPPASSHNVHRPPLYSTPASAPMPSSTCSGFQKLAHEWMSPWFQHLKCASLVHPGCKHVACVAPYTQTSHSSSCGCVLPIQVQLTLDVSLDALFEAIPMLIKDIASGVLLMQNQARIVGLTADDDDESKSVLDIDLVPLGNIFDNANVSMIFKKFQDHEVLSRDSVFQNYTLVYIRYSASPFPSGANSGVLPVAGIYPHEKPLSVDVTKRSTKTNGGTIAVIAVSSIIAVAAILGGIFLVFLRFKSLVKASGITKSSHMIGCKRSGSVLISSSENESPDAQSMSPILTSFYLPAKKYTFHELQRATDYFDTKNVLGQGGFGQVFCGMLEDGSKIAVKVITCSDQQRAKEFNAEVEMLCRLHHRNLVKLIGVCTEGHHFCLVYELVSNRSVDCHLHDTAEDAMRLDWDTRLKIALGSARGLAYLHEDANPRVIHRDFKASNILLEADFTPKISDFGLAKAAPDEENGHISTTVMGTFGYVAPEYAMTGHLLVKSDVYSYGVVLLELLSGRKPIDLSQPAGEESLVTWARCLMSSKEGLKRLIDPTLEGHVPLDSFARLAAIASMCVQPDASHRPFMGEVVQALKLVSNCAEGMSSLTTSPQDSGGESDHAGCLGCELISSSTNTSFLSLDYDSGTAGAIERTRASKKPESPFVVISNLDQCSDEPNHMFRRHSISGPSYGTGLNSIWSSERLYTQITMSESRIMKPCGWFCGTI